MRNSLSTILMSIAFLYSCDSGTQFCLDSERIKAELAGNLQEEMELEARLSALLDLDGKLAQHLAGTRAWIKINPQPKGSPVRPVPPTLQCADIAFGRERDKCRKRYDQEMGDYQRAKAVFERDLAAFQRSNAYIGWRREAEVESLRLANGIGFASETYDEFREIWDDYFYEVDSIVKPRSQIYKCYLERSCEKYAKNYEPADIYRLSIAEVESTQSVLVAQIKKEAQESASRLCK